jgi:hypothetical protein
MHSWNFLSLVCDQSRSKGIACKDNKFLYYLYSCIFIMNLKDFLFFKWAHSKAGSGDVEESGIMKQDIGSG